MRWATARARAAPSARLVCDLAAFLVPAIAYVASASHEPASWDTAELQGVPYILGISHPTGFPFYVLLGYAWSHAVPLGTIAFRLNVMSGIAVAGAAAIAYGTALELRAWRPIALFATLWFAFTQDVWSHAARAEAQDLAVVCEAIAVYAFVRWMHDGSKAWYLGAFAAFGLGLAAHPNALWLAPGLAIGALVNRERLNRRSIVAAFALTCAGLAFYLYLPLRSAYVVAHGLDPTHVLPGTGGGIFWNYNDPSTLAGFVRALTGTEWNAPHFFLASLNPSHVQDALWAFVSGIGEQFGAYVVILVIIGAVEAWRREWRTALFVCAACVAALMFSVTYPNEADVGRYRIMALWLAVPLLGSIVPRGAVAMPARMVRAALCVFLAIGAGKAFYEHRGFFARAGGEGGRWVIEAVQPVTTRGSVLVVDGWLDATSLAYGAYVDRSLPDRIIVSGWDPVNVDLYRRWAQTRRVFILVNPREVRAIAGARPVARLDSYHELFEVTR
ncbi:MAG: DUF2723 domain-containing protein [Candidatus Eremiobacteraeota bacterium]|nr:DUF2723 domain-containing protein [Candidatus Eremiobacteraeota bacterium]